MACAGALLILAGILPVAVHGATGHWIEIQSGGMTRHARVYLPQENKPSFIQRVQSVLSSADDDDEYEANEVRVMPVVFNFHPMALSPRPWKLMSDFTSLADKEGFIVVYPQGAAAAESLGAVIPGVPETWFTAGYTWNAGSCCPGASKNKIDDVQFVKDLINALRGGRVRELSGGRFDVDHTRLYATGGSNGAFLTYRLACEAPELFAAVAPVAAVLANETRYTLQWPTWPSNPFDCKKRSNPVPTLIFHGTLDPLVPMVGSPLLGFRSVSDNVNIMKRLNGIPESELGVVTYQNRGNLFYKVLCISYGSSRSNVTFCEIENGGHTWPGDSAACRATTGIPGSFCTTRVDATVQAWEFFKRYRLQGDKVREARIAVGDKIRINRPGGSTHGKVGTVTFVDPTRDVCKVDGQGISRDFNFPLAQVERITENLSSRRSSREDL